MLGATFLAAALANALNNVPALLVLLPAAALAGPHTVLAVLSGVNAGPNLTYSGSLVTLLARSFATASTTASQPPSVIHASTLTSSAIGRPYRG